MTSRSLNDTCKLLRYASQQFRPPPECTTTQAREFLHRNAHLFEQGLGKHCAEGVIAYLPRLPLNVVNVLPGLIGAWRQLNGFTPSSSSKSNRSSSVVSSTSSPSTRAIADPPWLDVKRLRDAALMSLEEFGRSPEIYASSITQSLFIVHQSCASGIDATIRKRVVSVLTNGFIRCNLPSGTKIDVDCTDPEYLEQILDAHNQALWSSYGSLAVGISKSRVREKYVARVCGLSAVPSAIAHELAQDARAKRFCVSRLLMTLEVLFQRKHSYHPKIVGSIVKLITGRLDELSVQESWRFLHVMASPGLPLSTLHATALYDKLAGNIDHGQSCHAALFFFKVGHFNLAARMLPGDDDIPKSDSQCLRVAANIIRVLNSTEHIDYCRAHGNIVDERIDCARPKTLRRWRLYIGRLAKFCVHAKRTGVVDSDFYRAGLQEYDIPDPLLCGTAQILSALGIEKPSDEWCSDARRRVRDYRLQNIALPGHHWCIRVYRACGLATYSEAESPRDAPIVWSGELSEPAPHQQPGVYNPRSREGPADPSCGCLIAAKVGKAARKFTRTGDTEFQALSKALTVYPDTNAHGVVRIYVDKTPCLSCIGVFAQFLHKRPNIKLEIGYDDTHENYMPAYQAGDIYSKSSKTFFDS